MSAEVRFTFAAKAMGTAVSAHIDDVVPQEIADDAWESVGVFLRDIEDRDDNIYRVICNTINTYLK